MPSLEIGSQAVSYREQGSGRPPVLLVHGAGGSSLQFATLVRLIGRQRRVVALDLPGHGGSEDFDPLAHPAELLERYRDLVAEAAERLGLGKIVLAGHSMGGAVAQLYALAYPDRLAGLVLMGTSARLKVAPPILATIRDRFDELPGMMAAVAYSPASAPRQVEEWAAQQLQAPRDVTLADFLACARFDIRERTPAHDCPTTIISGRDDRLTPPEVQQGLAERIPGVRLEVLSRAGHLMFLERPDLVAGLILETGA